MERGIFTKACCDSTKCNGFKLRDDRFRVGVKKNCFYCEDGKALEQVAQRCCGFPIPESIESQVGWGFETFSVVKDVPAHGSGVKLDDF